MRQANSWQSASPAVELPPAVPLLWIFIKGTQLQGHHATHHHHMDLFCIYLLILCGVMIWVGYLVCTLWIVLQSVWGSDKWLFLTVDNEQVAQWIGRQVHWLGVGGLVGFSGGEEWVAKVWRGEGFNLIRSSESGQVGSWPLAQETVRKHNDSPVSSEINTHVHPYHTHNYSLTHAHTHTYSTTHSLTHCQTHKPSITQTCPDAESSATCGTLSVGIPPERCWAWLTGVSTSPKRG